MFSRFAFLIGILLTSSTWAADLSPLERLLPNEADDISWIREGILDIQRKNRLPDGRLLRGTHSKGVCMGAEFEVFNLKDKRLAQGIYSKPAKYPAVVRFANAKSEVNPDGDADVRALSFWFDYPAGVFSPQAGRQDFAMNNAPTFPIKDAHVFGLLMKASLLGPLSLSLSEDALVAEALALGFVQQHQPLQPFQKMRYWSTVPFRHGANDVIKYSAIPCEQNPEGEITDSADSLIDNVLAVTNSRNRKSCFDFAVQFLDAENMRTFWLGQQLSATEWIEDASLTWNEDQAPFHVVGRLTLTPDSKISDTACERSRVDVMGNTLPEHRGLGSINRARQPAEKSSADARGGK